MIRNCPDKDFEEIFNIINDAAVAYKGAIPADGWHEPYMTTEDLRSEIEDGVRFSCERREGFSTNWSGKERFDSQPRQLSR